MGNSPYRGIPRLYQAFINSAKGLITAWREEEAFRLEVIMAAILIPLGIHLGQTGGENAMLAGSCIVVLIVEILNTGIEAVVDRIGLEHHSLSGKAKDFGSAAVLLSIVLFLCIWGLVLWN
jgi:diacylglycerol kinase (ATP)